MGKLLVVLLALLAPLPAYAGSFQDQNGMWWDLPMPPARLLDRPYAGELTLFHLEESNVARVCSAASGKAEQFGCSFPSPTTCTIYVSNDLPKPFRDAVEAHEVAHCNGWGADHPEE